MFEVDELSVCGCMAAPEKRSSGFRLVGCVDGNCGMEAGSAECAAPIRMAEVAADSRIDDQLDPVLGKGHLERVGVAVGGERAISERSHIKEHAALAVTQRDEAAVGQERVPRRETGWSRVESSRSLATEQPGGSRLQAPGDAARAGMTEKGRQRCRDATDIRSVATVVSKRTALIVVTIGWRGFVVAYLQGKGVGGACEGGAKRLGNLSAAGGEGADKHEEKVDHEDEVRKRLLRTRAIRSDLSINLDRELVK